MLRKNAWLCLCLLGCEIEEEALLLPEEVAGAVFDDGHDWDRITSYESDPSRRVDVLHGRTTARMIFPNGETCSGALIDDDILVTSEHCGAGQATASVYWGLYGPAAAGGSYVEGEADAKLRLVQLGVPLATVSALTWTQVLMFSCSRTSVDGTRDVAYWTCNNNNVSFIINGQQTTYGVKPGHLWGHLDVDAGLRQPGDSILAVSTNRLCGDAFRNVLMGEGEVVASSDTCVSGYSDCFTNWADHFDGSSGGPLIDPTTHALIGVIQGHWAPLWYILPPTDTCDVLLPQDGENTGAYLGPGYATYTSEDPDGGGEPLGASAGVTGALGSPPAAGVGIDCPTNLVAAGVVGTTTASGAIGNFGLVCVPHRAAGAQRLDRAVVISPGSSDTGPIPAEWDWAEFMAEGLSTAQPDLGQHTLAMCPPSYLLAGIGGRANGSVVGKVTALACIHPDTGAQASVPITPSTTGLIGVSALPIDTLICPAGTFIAGLDARSQSGRVIGIRGRCVNED